MEILCRFYEEVVEKMWRFYGEVMEILAARGRAEKLDESNCGDFVEIL